MRVSAKEFNEVYLCYLKNVLGLTRLWYVSRILEAAKGQLKSVLPVALWMYCCAGDSGNCRCEWLGGAFQTKKCLYWTCWCEGAGDCQHLCKLPACSTCQGSNSQHQNQAPNVSVSQLIAVEGATVSSCGSKSISAALTHVFIFCELCQGPGKLVWISHWLLGTLPTFPVSFGISVLAHNEHSQNNNEGEIWWRIKVNLLRQASAEEADVCCV